MNIEVYKELYEVINEWIELKPWEYLYSEDFVAVEDDNETYYCCIMGRMGDCIGVSIYTGDEGYADLISVAEGSEDPATTEFIMFSQSCLTFYLGDREEVPAQQRQIIKKLGLKYRGRGKWPFFMSFEPKLFPYKINDRQAIIMTKVFKQLIPTMKAYIANEIDVRFDEDEIIYTYKEDNQWKYEARVAPERPTKYMPVELINKELLQELKKQDHIDTDLIIDLNYISSPTNDKKYARPLNPICLLFLDATEHMIIDMRILDYEDDEIGMCLGYIGTFVQEYGIPHSIKIRNPLVLSALIDLCEELDIDLIVDDLPEVDIILCEMLDGLD
jgi:hypothetical protein